MDTLFSLIVAIVIGYVLGSFPSAYIAGRINGINIFQVGSGNMGMTNTLRALGGKWAVFVAVLDVGKGLLAYVIARNLPGDSVNNSVFGSIAAVVGHNWSIFVLMLTGKLRGGKGAAVSGTTWVLLFSNWWYLIVLPALACVGMLIITRIVSLSVLVTTAVGGVSALLVMTNPEANVPSVYLVYVVLIVTMIFYRHRENIQRLLQGRERRLGERI